MADDLLGGVLGGEDERSETEAPQALAGAEAFASAVAARLSGNDPGVARKTEIFLEKQAQLLDTQRQHLEDEHALRLAQLTHQRSLLRGQRIGQAIRIAFQIGIALVVLVIGAGIAVMLHDAFTSHSVVIDAFNAPAGLASRGVTGTAVASEVLNELTRLQSATRDSDIAQRKRSLSNGWSNDVKVDMPETGISLGEISRLLTARFGHDLHIGGDLIESASGGLALSVSGDGLSPKTFTGGADDLDKLVVDAAQYVYSQFEPDLWADYLSEVGRCPESIAFIKSAFSRADDQQRADLLSRWATCQMETDTSPSSRRQALELYQRAIELNPDRGSPYFNAEDILRSFGDEEGAWRLGRALRARRSAAGAGPWYHLTGDFRAVLDQLTAEAAANGGIGPFTTAAHGPLNIAAAEVRLHDPAAAELTLQTVQAGDQSPDVSSFVHFVRGLLAEEVGDVTQAEMEMSAVMDLIAANPAIAATWWPDECSIAPIEEAAGRLDQADAVLRSGGGHYVDCQRFRGDILDHRGDWAGAQKAYATAVTLAPDLPAGYYSWGAALARHGDLAGAIAKLEAANQRGPHWADPLKAWGDVLVKQGRPKEALAKYDQALKYAPNWSALHAARNAAATPAR